MKSLAVAAILVGCSNPQSDLPDANAEDASAAYPAFDVPIVQVESRGGPVMHDLRVVPVYWSGDPGASTITAFLIAFTTSSYWPAMTAEYGVTGTVEIATPVTLAVPAPATTSDASIRQLIASRLDGAHPAWGPTDAAAIARTIYLLHFPQMTDGTGPHGAHSCTSFGGYHASFPFNAGAVIYAVVYDCPGTQGFAPTAVIGHELVEAATDPLLGRPAYNQLAPAFAAWGLQHGNELGDLCEGLPARYVTPADLGFRIQRSWSNAAARGHHDPCVPAPTGAYFAAVPIEPDLIGTDVIGTGTMMPGTSVALGQSRTIDVQLFSDGPSPSWTIDAVDSGHASGHALELSFDQPTGTNGGVVRLTISALTRPTTGIVSYRILSTIDDRKTFWWGAVGVTP